MPDLPRPLLRHTQPDHFVVAPESAVHHHAICVLEERPNMRLDLQKAGSIEDRRSGLGIGDAHADIVALVRLIATRRVWRGVVRGRGPPKTLMTPAPDTPGVLRVRRHSL